MNGYELSRAFWDYAFEHPEKIRPVHSAIFFFAIEHCNRLGWKSKFGFPTTMAMDAIGVKSYNTYTKALNELVDYGFVKMIEKSKNQYSANIIALSKNNKATDKALDKALIKHGTKQSESNYQSTVQSTVSINKQYNNKPLTEDFDAEGYKDEISKRDNQAWRESWYMKFKTKPNTLSQVIDKFNIHLGLKDQTEQPKNLKEYKQHFYNWCNVQERIGKLDEYKKGKKQGAL